MVLELLQLPGPGLRKLQKLFETERVQKKERRIMGRRKKSPLRLLVRNHHQQITLILPTTAHPKDQNSPLWSTFRHLRRTRQISEKNQQQSRNGRGNLRNADQLSRDIGSQTTQENRRDHHQPLLFFLIVCLFSGILSIINH